MHAALYGRVLSTLRTWLGERRIELDLDVVAPNGEAALEREGDRVRAALPLSWLVDVWAAGLGTVAGRFCLSARRHEDEGWSLVTIDADLRTRHVVTVERSPRV